MRGWFIVLLVGFPLVARAGDMARALRAHDWGAAQTLAAGSPDPVAGKLVRYLRLLTKGAGSAEELDAFLAAAPGWPKQGLLERRYAEALAAEADDGRARAQCLRRAPALTPALLRCAGLVPGGAEMARLAWLTGVRDAAGETSVMRRWGSVFDPALQRERFERLAWTQSAAPGERLARQAVRLAPSERPMAEARLALRRDDPSAAKLVAALPEAERSDPGMVLDLLRWFRRAHRWGDAVQGWAETGKTAEVAAPADEQRRFWAEREVLARDLLRERMDEPAYAVVAGPVAAVRDWSEADFLRGWIALRRLNRAELAAEQFRLSAGETNSALGKARAQYWLGRALAGDAAGAAAAYQAAAAWPTTYYGQLAALAGGVDMAGLVGRLRSLADPAWDEAAALSVTRSEFGRAAALLVAWDEGREAKPFLLALAGDGTPPRLALLARYGTALGLPDVAVALARRAASEGEMLPVLGWPAPVDPPGPVERAVALGLIRQESSFDAAIGSPAGAQGLMQLMPQTAAEVAHRLGVPAEPLSDAALNMRLGTAYLARLLERLGAVPPALAGYNAGLGRVRQWLAAYGDPAAGEVDPVDWVELIPFAETRGYVQRVVANVVMYRARAGVVLPHPVLVWTGGKT